MIDLYQVLGIEKDADDKTIKSAYRIKAQLYHPDKQNGDNEKFLEVKRAYEILSNKERRKLYDLNGSIDAKVNLDIFTQAKQEVGSLFMQFCLQDSVINPLQAVEKQLLKSKEHLEDNKEHCFANRVLLLKRKKNLSFKGKEDNLLIGFITQARQQNVLSYKDLKQKLKLCDFMLEYIADYSYYTENSPTIHTFTNPNLRTFSNFNVSFQ